jgi:hypothetical protein
MTTTQSSDIAANRFKLRIADVGTDAISVSDRGDVRDRSDRGGSVGARSDRGGNLRGRRDNGRR